MDSNKQDSDGGHCGVPAEILQCAMNSLGWLMPESETQVAIAESELSGKQAITLPESLSTFESFLNSQTHRPISHYTIANFDSGDAGGAGGAGGAGASSSLARAARSGAKISPEIEARMAADRRIAENKFETE